MSQTCSCGWERCMWCFVQPRPSRRGDIQRAASRLRDIRIDQWLRERGI